MDSLLEIATAYVKRGWKVIPIPHKEKGPKLKGWQNLRFVEEQLSFVFDGRPQNIGLLCGDPSGMVCVDLDHPVARQFAPLFLPETGLKSGRSENPDSHWFYSLDKCPPTEKFRIPAHAKADIHHTVELLSTGAQVVVGPSEHPSGDVYSNLEGEPAKVSPEDLRTACLALHRAVLAKLGIAEEIPKTKPAQPANQNNNQNNPTTQTDLRTALEEHGAEIICEAVTTQGCPGYHIECPRKDLHSTPTHPGHTMAWTGTGGGYQAKCVHASCGIESWIDLRTALNPSYQTKEEILAQVDISGLMPGNDPDNDDDDEDDFDEELENQIGAVELGFPEDCLRPPGLLQRIVDYNLATARYPQPEHALAGALSLMSLITGRRVRDASDTRTNLMIVALGPTRSGKEHPRQINKKILEKCSKSALYEEKLASHSSLHGFLKQDNVGLLMNDEFGDFLALARATKGANTQPAQIISAMIKLYSSASGLYKADRYADNVKQVEINQPHLVLYGTSTGEVFWKHVTPEYLSGGLFGRVMIFENRGYVDPQSVFAIPDIPGDIIRDVNNWLNCFSHHEMVFWLNPMPLLVPHTIMARERFEQHELAISAKRKRETPIRAALWSGAAEITAKLALLFACSRSQNPLVIELCDVDLAIRLSNWLTRRKVELSGDNVAENQTESSAKRVFRIIKSAGKSGISMRQLSRKTQWLKHKERQELIMGLVESRIIYRDNVKTGRRDKTVLIVMQHARQMMMQH